MSKYVIEHKKKSNTYLAWISIFLLIFNVYHTRIMIIFSLYSTESTLLVQALSFGLLVIYLVVDKNLDFRKIELKFLDVLLIFTLIIIVLTTKDISGNLTYIVRYAMLISFVILMKYDEKLIEIAFVCIMLSGMLHIIFTIWFYFDTDFYLSNIFSYFDAQQRSHLYAQVVHNGYATGMASHYSQNGIYLSIALCCTSTLLYKKSKYKLIYVIMFLISVVAIFMTGKRGVLIFIVFAMVITYMVCGSKSTGNRLVKAVFLILASILFLYVLSFYVESIALTFERINKTLFANETTDISNGRFKIYNIAWEFFLENPLTGIGWREFTNEVSVFYRGSAQLLDAHNVFLQLLCEAGILGFITFMTLFVSSYLMTLKCIFASKRNAVKVVDVAMYFSLCYQTFFLCYCITGNPLYDLETLYVYIISIGICSLGNYKQGCRKNVTIDLI